MKRRVGVLALQGAFAKHREMIHRLGAECVEVRKPEELERCDGLVIPGGESTAMMHRIDFIGIGKSLRQFALEKPVFGTCAGLILLSKEVVNHPIKPFGFLDITVERNGYGRQIESFDAEVIWKKKGTVQGRFIRAPRLVSVGQEVEVLAELNGEPVCVQFRNILASAFHSELVGDLTLHRHFLKFFESF